MEPGTAVEGLSNAPAAVPRHGQAVGRQRQRFDLDWLALRSDRDAPGCAQPISEFISQRPNSAAPSGLATPCLRTRGARWLGT